MNHDAAQISLIARRIAEEIRRSSGASGGGADSPVGPATRARIRSYGLADSAGNGAGAAVEGAALRAEELGVAPSGRPTVTCNVSNRHIHLTRADFETLFGAGAELTRLRDLMQPGQFASNETVSLIAGRGRVIEAVRILGPLRRFTQVEISRTDGYWLGIRPPVRASGDVKGSAAGTLVGPKGTLVLGEGIIVADRHIHTPPTVAERLGLKNNQYVAARVFHTEKPMTLERVRIRIGEEFVLEMHLDNDDANAAGISSGDRVEVIH